MKDIKYFQDKCERLEKVITMRECQLRCACDGLEDFARTGKEGEEVWFGIAVKNTAQKTLDAIDAIYELHQGKKIADGFLEPKKRG